MLAPSLPDRLARSATKGERFHDAIHPGTPFACRFVGCRGRCGGCVLLVTPAVGAPPQVACDNRTNNTYDKLLECVRVEGVREHQAAFQAIANANGGTRAAATPGYDASVDYVVEDAQGGRLVGRAPRVRLHGRGADPAADADRRHARDGCVTGSALGTVTAAVIPVDINLTPPRASTSGCDGAFTEAAVGAPLTPDPAGPNDFAGFPAGQIALIQRGGCSFALKVANAQAAGAGAVIIFNQGNTPDRSGLIVGTAVPPAGSNVDDHRPGGGRELRRR